MFRAVHIQSNSITLIIFYVGTNAKSRWYHVELGKKPTGPADVPPKNPAASSTRLQGSHIPAGYPPVILEYEIEHDTFLDEL